MKQDAAREGRPRSTATAGTAIAVAIVLSCALLDWDFSALTDPALREQAFSRLYAFLNAFDAPNLSAEYLHDAMQLSWQTLAVAALGTLLGAVFGYMLALLASERFVLGSLPRPTVRDSGLLAATGYWLHRGFVEAARLWLDVLRGVPDFAWAIMILAIPGPGAVTGIAAIAVSVSGILGKIYSEQWDNVDPRRFEMLTANGSGRLMTFAYAVQPMALPSMLSFTLMRGECAVRNASVIGVVGGGGLGAQMFDEFNFGNYDNVVTLLLATLVLTASVDIASNIIRSRLRSDPNHPRAARDLSVRSVNLRRLGVLMSLVVGVILCWSYLGGTFGGPYEERPPLEKARLELERIEWDLIAADFKRLLQPELLWWRSNELGEQQPGALQQAVQGSAVPLALGVLGTLGGIVLAMLLCFPGSVGLNPESDRYTGEAVSPLRRAGLWVLVVCARGLALVQRAVPEVAWLWVFATFFLIGVIPAILAMAVHSAGVLARVFIERVDNIPYRQFEQTYTGSRPVLFAYVAAPIARNDWMTYSFFQFESNVRAGVMLGIIGVGGLGDSFDTSFNFMALERASTFLIAMVLLTTAIDRTSRALKISRVRAA